jgi:hypothetical protein
MRLAERLVAKLAEILAIGADTVSAFAAFAGVTALVATGGAIVLPRFMAGITDAGEVDRLRRR